MTDNEKPIIICGNCDSLFYSEDELDIFGDDKGFFKGCPKCQTDEFLGDLD